MLYYHGSRSNFTEFTIPGDGKHGEGFYFTADKSEANHFARSLYGTGEDNSPTIYTVNLKVLSLLDTMNIDHCKQVMKFFGYEFKSNKNAGGAKEQYYYLSRQLSNWGIKNINEAIKSAGFDGIHWAFMDHVIVFDSHKIEIVEKESLD